MECVHEGKIMCASAIFAFTYCQNNEWVILVYLDCITIWTLIKAFQKEKSSSIAFIILRCPVGFLVWD